MNMESQTVEWKKEWKDEFLKEIVAFANTDGGFLKIGIDDDGKIVGISNPKQLMKKISDTIANKLSMYPHIAYDETTGTITITVEKSPVPIDLDGKFFLRSGNTVHVAKGREYDRIVSKRLNISWMDQPVSGIGISDLDQHAIKQFRLRSSKSGKINEVNLSISDEDLFTKLGIMVNHELTRTAVLLFHPTPEDILTCSFTKLGMFNGSDVLYQDMVGGPLILRLDAIIEKLSSKYLIRPITYDGIRRVDNDQYPEKSLRECIINAIVHNDYSSYIPVQIRVWKDKLMVSDSGGLPDNWTIDDLLSSHKSEPVNPKLAYAFFVAGFIENWGRGIEKIQEEYSGSDKQVLFKAGHNFFQVIMDAIITLDDIVKPAPEPVPSKSLSPAEKILSFSDIPEGRSISEITELLGLSSKSSVSRNYIRPLLSVGLLEYTIPETPTSRSQKYRTTDTGRNAIRHN